MANAIDTYDVGLNWGPADWQQNHILGINYVYELPFLRTSHSFAGKAWEAGKSPVLCLRQRSPLQHNRSQRYRCVGDNFNQNAELISGCDPNKGPHSRTQWFTQNCFTTPTGGTFGNSGRNSVWGPRSWNLDFALYKNGGITDRLKYQFRTEFFNVFNHPSFNCGGCVDGSQNNALGDSSFGVPTGANDPREIQFALRLTF